MQRNTASLSARRKRALTDAITAAKGSKSELELIIGTEAARKEEVARQLERIGQVRHVYEFVPYLSLKCDADYADILQKASSGNVSDSVFEKAFRHIIPAISGIDVSNNFSIPKIKARKATAAVVIERPRTKSSLWNLEAIGAYKAQQYASGDGVKVAVIDTGIDYSHSQLRGRFGSDKGYDFVNNTEEPMDENGHGTHVAGIVASVGYGVAPGSGLYAVRVLDENGSGSEADAIAGIEWCIKNKVDVANMSFGSPVASQALEEVCSYAWQQGILLVAAAGNNGYGANYPAAFGESVIAVAAVDEELGHPDFSSIYETNDIAAPGVGILSTYLDERYATLTGTSMASPHVAGSLALALSISHEGSSLEDVMKKEAEKLGEADTFGAGLVRVDNIASYLSENSHYAGKKALLPLLKGYLRLEKKADAALKGFADDAVAELRRMFS
ncbi:S8 family peptidase [Candidatus Woesearchaeota archaeon]|nr:S8 family peptidase [Candidatus Woesearchaeota archaeon]